MSEIKSSTEWKKILQSFKKSGLTATQWCKEQKLSYHAFMYWHYKFYGRITDRARPNEKSKDSNNKWLAVDTGSSNVINQSAKSIIPQGIKVSVGKADITVNDGFDKALLQDVVKVLSSLC